ncbi:MAG: hypothetical protein A2Z02_01225, partial [Chloroflexi bacterium RBG_16_48_7]
MLYDVVIVICLVVVTLNLILNLRCLKIPSSASRLPDPAPRVSVLIPARNEHDNIGTCLDSLQRQDYPDFEVLVLNDGSTDNTAAIVEAFRKKDSRIRLIQGKELPPGWAGKAHACYQLARNASGSWILFVDADTVHSPIMLRSVMAIALESHTSLLSGFPRQVADGVTQKITIPVFNFIIMSWLPMWWLQRGNKPRPSLANGQFLLFPKDEYFRIGGHESVKNRILEDVMLGAQVYRKKGKVLAVDLSPVVSCHMYRNVADMWHGFAKSIYAFTASPWLLPVLGFFAYVLFLGPYYALCNQAFARDSWWYLALIQVLIILFMRVLVNSH